MQGKDAIRSAMNLSDMVFKGYLGDLEDSELMRRPAEGCNHLAWQVGHLIASEVSLLSSVFPDRTTELPDGFVESHAKENSDCDDPSQFLSRDEYIGLMEKVRATTLSALESASEEELDKPSPDQFQPWCPTVGDMFVLIGTHPLMHAGQIVPVRRACGKPVLF